MSDSKRYSLIAFSGDMWSLYKSNMKGMIYFVRIKRFQNRKKSIYSTLLIKKRFQDYSYEFSKGNLIVILITFTIGYTCVHPYSFTPHQGVPSYHIYYIIPVHPYTSPLHQGFHLTIYTIVYLCIHIHPLLTRGSI